MSWIEVEVKVKIDNPNLLRDNIKKIAKFVDKEKKIDDYYSLNYNGTYPRKSLRIRDFGKNVEVNFKQWLSYRFGIHAKNEVEFGVTDLGNFFDLLKEFGFKKWLRKEKITELYKTKDGIHIELNNVKELGWFIEIEKLCDKKEIKKARKRILELFKHLGLEKKDIEKKGYTKMLWNLKKVKKL